MYQQCAISNEAGLVCAFELEPVKHEQAVATLRQVFQWRLTLAIKRVNAARTHASPYVANTIFMALK